MFRFTPPARRTGPQEQRFASPYVRLSTLLTQLVVAATLLPGGNYRVFVWFRGLGLRRLHVARGPKSKGLPRHMVVAATLLGGNYRVFSGLEV